MQLQRYNDTMRKYANQRRRDVTYNVGDLVYVSTGNLRLSANLSRKLAPRWVGPYPVSEVISHVAIRVDLPASFRSIHNVFHVSVIKMHLGDPPLRRSAVFRPETEEQEFEVERIVGKRLTRNRTEYLVHWKGYSAYD